MIKNSQVFTPKQSVEELLERIEYKHDIFGKKIIDNACGDGSILIEVVQRYIQDALDQSIDKETIKQSLQNNIHGIELDEQYHKICINNLDIVVEKFNIKNVQWNIILGDTLTMHYIDEFDYVIGNPPYISYRDLDENIRKYVKDNYETCKSGKFDYCYAFIEASIKSLKHSGQLAYLIPSSIFKNVFAQELRDFTLDTITDIIDFTTKKLFQNVLTSSAILVCQKDSRVDFIYYHDVVKKEKLKISKQQLFDKWVFSTNKDTTIKQKRFGDYFHTAYSIATLRNKIFVIKDYIEESEFYTIGQYKIEKQLLRKAASPRSIKYHLDELLIFPYEYKNNTLKQYNKDEFELLFPQGTLYLKANIEELEKRKSDKSAQWFEYGRSQALTHLNQPKLLISTVITNRVSLYSLSKEEMPYSGIYIVPKQDMSLEDARDILEREEFYQYIQSIGICASGNSLRITSSDINNYMFN